MNFSETKRMNLSKTKYNDHMWNTITLVSCSDLSEKYPTHFVYDSHSTCTLELVHTSHKHIHTPNRHTQSNLKDRNSHKTQIDTNRDIYIHIHHKNTQTLKHEDTQTDAHTHPHIHTLITSRFPVHETWQKNRYLTSHLHANHP